MKSRCGAPLSNAHMRIAPLRMNGHIEFRARCSHLASARRNKYATPFPLSSILPLCHAKLGNLLNEIGWAGGGVGQGEGSREQVGVLYAGQLQRTLFEYPRQ